MFMFLLVSALKHKYFICFMRIPEIIGTMQCEEKQGIPLAVLTCFQENAFKEKSRRGENNESEGCKRETVKKRHHFMRNISTGNIVL